MTQQNGKKARDPICVCFFVSRFYPTITQHCVCYTFSLAPCCELWFRLEVRDSVEGLSKSVYRKKKCVWVRYKHKVKRWRWWRCVVGMSLCHLGHTALNWCSTSLLLALLSPLFLGLQSHHHIHTLPTFFISLHITLFKSYNSLCPCAQLEQAFLFLRSPVLQCHVNMMQIRSFFYPCYE